MHIIYYSFHTIIIKFTPWSKESGCFYRGGHPGQHDLNLLPASDASCVRHRDSDQKNDSHTDKMIPDIERYSNSEYSTASQDYQMK